MSRLKKLSIIIPAFNRINYLIHCLKYLWKQSIDKKLYEIIIVDDGSTDETKKMLNKLNVNFISTVNKGAASARNEGLKIAKGEIIVFIDSDILVQSNFLQNILTLYNRKDLVLIGPRRFLNKNVTTISKKDAALDEREILFKTLKIKLDQLNHPWFLCYTSNLIVHKSLACKELFDENYKGWGLEDADFAYRLHKNKAKFVFSKKLTCYHMYHGNFTNTKKYNEWLKNLDYFVSKYRSEPAEKIKMFADYFDPNKKPNNSFEKYKIFEGLS